MRCSAGRAPAAWRAAVLVVALGASLAARAAAPHLTEYQIKAGFLFNFANLVEWPAATPPTLALCVAGEDPFGGADAALDGKAIGSRRIAVRHSVPDAGLGSCQIVFVAASYRDRLKPLLEQLAGRPVLTVGDAPGLAAQGLVASFYREGDKVRFEINVDAARRAQLPVSSRLLQLARIVHDEAAAR